MSEQTPPDTDAQTPDTGDQQQNQTTQAKPDAGPDLSRQVEELTAGLIMFVVGANTAFGVLFGYLFWRYGLEAAIFAHALSHVVSYIIAMPAA